MPRLFTNLGTVQATRDTRDTAFQRNNHWNPTTNIHSHSCSKLSTVRADLLDRRTQSMPGVRRSDVTAPTTGGTSSEVMAISTVPPKTGTKAVRLILCWMLRQLQWNRMLRISRSELISIVHLLVEIQLTHYSSLAYSSSNITFE